MKTFYVATIISAAATLISASPVADIPFVEAREVDARTTYGEFCDNANFVGPCFVDTKLGTCFAAGGANNKISSLRTYGNTCILYLLTDNSNGDCTGDAASFHGYYPTIPKQYNDKFSSVRCHA